MPRPGRVALIGADCRLQGDPLGTRCDVSDQGDLAQAQHLFKPLTIPLHHPLNGALDRHQDHGAARTIAGRCGQRARTAWRLPE